jgi:hypothetical protein
VAPQVSVAANLGYRFYARNLHRFYTCDWFLGGAEPLPAAAAETPAGPALVVPAGVHLAGSGEPPGRGAVCG